MYIYTYYISEPNCVFDLKNNLSNLTRADKKENNIFTYFLDVSSIEDSLFILNHTTVIKERGTP